MIFPCWNASLAVSTTFIYDGYGYEWDKENKKCHKNRMGLFPIIFIFSTDEYYIIQAMKRSTVMTETSINERRNKMTGKNWNDDVINVLLCSQFENGNRSQSKYTMKWYDHDEKNMIQSNRSVFIHA